MKVTIEDIAKAANVAKSTVSKVMNDSPKISGETKARVRRIMEELNYIPNGIATGLARQSSCNIGLLIDMSRQDEFLNQFFYPIIGGIESVIGPLKYELTISNVQSGPQGQGVLNRLVLSKRVDGVIANSSVLNEDLTEALRRSGVPFLSIGEIGSPASWVDFDNELGGYTLTRHLLEQGYSRIAFIGGERLESIFSRRHAGYMRAMSEHGKLPLNTWTINGQADEHTGYRTGLELLGAAERPDAVVCMNNYAAFGLLRAAAELGVRIPQELGVAAFDDYPLSRYTTPPLTALHIDTFRLGVAAGELLMERISGNPPHRQLLLVPELIVRESSRRVKG